MKIFIPFPVRLVGHRSVPVLGSRFSRLAREFRFERSACTRPATTPTVSPTTMPTGTERQLGSIDSASGTATPSPIAKFRLVVGRGSDFGLSLMPSSQRLARELSDVMAHRNAPPGAPEGESPSHGNSNRCPSFRIIAHLSSFPLNLSNRKTRHEPSVHAAVKCPRTKPPIWGAGLSG